jgi:putative YhbY family RNA-binding protein
MVKELRVPNTLTSTERRELRARAHHLRPVVMIGEAGLTPEVTQEIDLALKSHELIKIRVLGDERAARKDLISSICEATGAQSVQQIGKTLVIYRARPAEEEAPAPRRPRRKAPRRTKQSYQNT